MTSRHSRNSPPSPLIQLGVNFIIPTVILLYLSGSSQLGPLGAMGAALAFPIGLEVYNLLRKQKPSIISIISIAGILLIGLISVLGLSKDWLALRRSIVYAVGAIVLLLIVKFKPVWIEKGLDRILEMEGVRKAGRKNNTEAQLFRYVVHSAYAVTVVLAIVAIASYVLTIAFITAPTGSGEFNAQYAELRVLSLFVITLPFMVALVGILVHLIGKFEKLTGISAENLIKKRNTPSEKRK